MVGAVAILAPRPSSQPSRRRRIGTKSVDVGVMIRVHAPFDAVQPIHFRSVDRLQVACIKEIDHPGTG